MRRPRSTVERLAVCWRCQTTDTEQVAFSEAAGDLVYSAWCWTCRDHYNYRIRIENVRDKQNRI